MKYQNLQFFNSNGYNLNLSVSSYISFNVSSYTGSGANLLGVTDINGHLIDTYSLGKGYMYYNDLNDLSIELIYALDSSKNKYLNLNTNDPECDASVNFINVTVNNADNILNTLGIDSLTFTDKMLNDSYVYPSISLAGNIFMEPVSKGLVSTLSLYILEEFFNNDSSIKYEYKRPVDNNKKLVFTLNNDNIRFFNINNNLQEVQWTNKIIFDLSDNNYPDNQPLQLNIGFIGDAEGIYEEHLNIFIEENNKYSLIGEILINAECIDEDERFRTLFNNFGIPDPISYSKIFKESNINESKLDYNLINKKSKELFLEYSKIFPFVGTYKALINAVKFLGYDDITFREWFLNLIENRYDTYEVSYDSANRAKTLLNESIEKRIGLKKLNKLSMIYKINKESEETDNYGIPIVNNVYDYNNEEVLLKLFYLKKWLENNIIGVNCRIIDITGEGIYFERYDNKIYSTTNKSFELTNIKSLTPITLSQESELIDGSANICVSFDEFNNTTINDYYNTPIKLFIDYIYDVSNNSIIDINEYDYSNNQIVVSPPIQIPTLLNTYQFKCSVNTESGTLCSNIDNPLWIIDNEIKFYNHSVNESTFGMVNNEFNYLKLPTIQIEEGYLRDSTNNSNWNNSIVYKILYDTNDGMYKIIDVRTNTTVLVSYDYITLTPNSSSSLKYTINNKFNIPLFLINGYDIIAQPKNSSSIMLLSPDTLSIDNVEYILDIGVGKIINYDDDYKTTYINFNYSNESEQSIKLNVVYTSNKYNFYEIDPIEYYNNGTLLVNSSICLNVNNIGNYYIESYAYDNYNNVFYNKINNLYNVYMNQPDIYIYTVQNHTNNSSTFYSENKLGDIDNTVDFDYVLSLYNNNSYPIQEKQYRIDGITINQASPTGDPFDLNPNAKGPMYITYPSKSYYIDTPKLGDLLNIMNLTEECNINIDSSGNVNYITLKDNNISSQKFYINDNIHIVFYDDTIYKPILEIDNYIINIEKNNLYLKDQIILNEDYHKFKSNIKIFIQNKSEYNINSLENDTLNNENVIKIATDSLYNNAFLPNQMVKIIYKVINASDNSILYYGSTTYKYLKFDSGYHILSGSCNINLLNSFVINLSNNNPDLAPYILGYTYIAYANQTFVNYNIDVLHSYEENGYTNVFVSDNNYLLNYIDNTFSLYNLKFNPLNAYEYWMGYYTNASNNVLPEIIVKEDTTLLNWVYTGEFGQNGYTNLQNVYYRDHDNQLLYKVRYSTIQEYLPIYKYNIPITIDYNLFYINNINNTCNIILDSVYDDPLYIDEKNNIWSVYLNNDNENKLLFEVFNESLFLTLQNRGIYSFKLKTYDKYGNLIEQYKNGFIKF